MRHPAENYIKFLIISNPQRPDGELVSDLTDWGFLTPEPAYFPFIRAEIPATPAGFDPTNRLHRPTAQYLRDNRVYEAFFPNDAFSDALELLGDPEKRILVEQILLARLDLKQAARRVNERHNLHLTVEALETYRHYFWNVGLLTFDDWGRYLFGRSALYEQYMALLRASPSLAYYHLRLDQQVESKNMIRRIQEIAYFTAEEVALKPGTGMDKIKAIGILGKTVNDCHASLSTSDVALKDVLAQFQNFRMQHPQLQPLSINQLAPAGNFSGSGASGLLLIEGGASKQTVEVERNEE